MNGERTMTLPDGRRVLLPQGGSGTAPPQVETSEKGGGLEASLLTARQRVDLPPPDPNPPPPRARLTMVGAIHHQSPDGQITSADLRGSEWLESDEQPYVRHLRLKTEWTPLRLDWIEDPRIVVIRNNGISHQVNPTAEQREAADLAWVEVGVQIGQYDEGPNVVPFAIVRPWESLPFCPENVEVIRLRAITTVVPISIYAFPR